MTLSQVTGVLTLERAVSFPAGSTLLTVHLPEGGEAVVVDTLGCKPGDRVVLGGSESAAALLGTNCPADAVVVAVVK